MRKLCVGVMAHVDSGKTTLSESMLYVSGTIKKLGRVDNGDAFLDTFDLEKKRGITIYSKQANFQWKDTEFTLLDTPGHVDFSAEMERTLQVLDAAILVISGTDGVQGHTATLWRLLERYEIPVFLFVNKMDQPGTNMDTIMDNLQSNLSEHCINFTEGVQSEEVLENIAMCDENSMEAYLEHGVIEKQDIVNLIASRKVYPCCFGSALKMDGIEAFVDALAQYAVNKPHTQEFGAKVYKIARDEQGNRLTYLKVTGGVLKVKDLLHGMEQNGLQEWQEKVNQIRIYSGSKYTAVNEAEAGTICAVMGLSKTWPGEALGVENPSELPLLEPILQYRLILPPECEPNSTLLKLRQLEEEEPALHIVWEEKLQEIQIQLMGEVQIEVLKSVIWERFHIEVSFGKGRIVYKETIANTVEGIGHFEPLRHYAEVHLLLEPGEQGSGIQVVTDCSEDVLDRNWQRLIVTHMEEKEHKGVLIGAAITDMKMTLIAGKAHLKHTEGGDFRQATYRAIRQGLMQAETILLEPYYAFKMELPTDVLGRAMADIEKMHGTFDTPEPGLEISVLSGSVPVASVGDYQIAFQAYTRGKGRLQLTLKGYYPCHNTEEVLEEYPYDPEADLSNPTGSVFCSHGAGIMIPWYQVAEYAHIEPSKEKTTNTKDLEAQYSDVVKTRRAVAENNPVVEGVTQEELDEIFSRTYHSNQKETSRSWKKTIRATAYRTNDTTEPVAGWRKKESVEEYLLVDGYNVIYAWEDLSELAKTNLHGARTKLMDILCNYQGYKKCKLILVFDAYRVEGHKAEISTYHNIHVVYTAHAETADQYIEKFAHEMGRKYHVTVATSDGLEQIIIRGQGCQLLSSRDLKVEIERTSEHIRENYLNQQDKTKNYLLDNWNTEFKTDV